MRYKKKPAKLKDLTILVDDREKKGWTFLKQSYTIERTRLKTADYTIKGYEDIIAIEKKSGLRELFGNLTSCNRQRFIRFLDRLSKYPIKAIVVDEALSFERMSYHLMLLRKKSNCGLTPNTIYYWLDRISIYYGIPVIFAGPKSTVQVVEQVFKQAIERIQDNG